MKEVKLTAHQLEAVDVSQRHRDACVVAGPGSGKTTVLVEYFGRLVAEGVDPLRILAITFTEKAAANMKQKLAKAFEHDPEKRRTLERAWVATVHGFCTRLLKENAVFAGVDPEFVVADARESLRLQQESMETAVVALFAERPEAVRDLIGGLQSRDFEEAVRDAYDAMRGAGISIEEVAAKRPPKGTTMADVEKALRELRADPLERWKPEQRLYRNEILVQGERILTARDPEEALRAIAAFSVNLNKCKRGTPAQDLVKRLRDELLENLQYALITELYEREREVLLEILRRFDATYRERKRQAGVLDFSDLEEYAVRLLQESPETRARLQMQFDHIVMDEFQDTNGQQARLLELLRRPGRFYAVGDINQSIYGFRHADLDVFRRYRAEVERQVELDDNFRSRPDILMAVETMAEGAAGIEPRGLQAGKVFEQPREVCVETITAVAQQVDDALRIEARHVARRILELVEDSAPPLVFRDVAVLVRNTEVLKEFTDAFEEAGIPYVVTGGRGFYDLREVRDLQHLLRVIANPLDEVSLAAVLRSPLALVSDEALLQMKGTGENLGAALMHLKAEDAAGLDAEDFARLCRFRGRLREWRARREHVTYDRLLLSAIDDCGYPREPGSREWANIEKFLMQARQAATRMSLDEWVEELALVRASNPREVDVPPDDAANAVNVMTVHAAKGLEFPAVFVAALHKGTETNPPVVAFSREFGLGARWRNPGTGKEKDDLFQHAIRDERKKREAAESDRLLYVAMTRAEEHLVLSHSAAGKKRESWADDVTERLKVEPEPPREEVVRRPAPNGEEWALRVLVTERPPEPRVARKQAEANAPEAAERVAPPAVTDQQDTNATVTDVRVFANCPHEYYLGNYLGFEGRPRPLRDTQELAAAEMGIQVHALLAGTAVADPDPEAARLAEVFRQSPLGKRMAKAARVEREFDFRMAVEGTVLSGSVDLWYEEGGELTIVDYKTDAVTAVEAHQRAQDYVMQLRLYARAVEQMAGRAPDRAWLHFLRPNVAIEVDLTPSLLDAPEAVLREFQEAQARLEFPLREGPRCRRCQFFHDLCPSAYGGA